MSAAMTETPNLAKDKTSEIEALSSAFAAFVRVTEELRSSYERLRERADRIDLELARANESLRDKVAELDRLSSHLNGVLAAIPSGVVVSDETGRVTDLNETAQRILGVSRDAAIGKSREEFCDAEGSPLLLDPKQSAAEKPTERKRVHRNGALIVLGGAVSALPSRHGHPEGSVEVIEDLTEISDLRERLHRVDKLAALGEMSAVIAHEIRNPLNGVQGFADLLSRKLAEGDTTLANYAKKIVRGVREVDAIVADLLAFASPERFQPVSIDLESIVRQAAESVTQSHATEMRCEISFAQQALRISGDALKLGQIFRNLISNAAQAAVGKGAIRVQGTRVGARIAVSIEDDGPGIPETLRAKVFDPFFTTKTQGTGLGLAIVRKLVELHAGQIALAPAAPGRGARFELSFPAS